jgi:hypothetical protein
MARFIVIHQVVENASLDDMLAARQALRAAAQGSIEWRNSWYIPANGEMLCEWEAPGQEAIREALTQSGATRFVPIKAIHEVVPAGPKDYPGEFPDP